MRLLFRLSFSWWLECSWVLTTYQYQFFYVDLQVPFFSFPFVCIAPGLTCPRINQVNLGQSRLRCFWLLWGNLHKFGISWFPFWSFKVISFSIWLFFIGLRFTFFFIGFFFQVRRAAWGKFTFYGHWRRFVIFGFRIIGWFTFVFSWIFRLRVRVWTGFTPCFFFRLGIGFLLRVTFVVFWGVWCFRIRFEGELGLRRELLY